MVHPNYDKIIDYILNSKKKKIEIDQAIAKKLINCELPKSLFNMSYIKQQKNDLCRFLMANPNKYKIKIISPKIVIEIKEEK